jgi:hypothetical protein
MVPSVGSTHHGSHHHGAVKLVVFPGEGKNAGGVVVGHVYAVVAGAVKAKYPIAGGPPPGRGTKGEGGHTAGKTPAGVYVLGVKERHTTLNWPTSVVPFGAPVRDSGGIIEYQMGGAWHRASGVDGAVTRAWLRWFARSHRPVTVASASQRAYEMFFFKGTLIDPWIVNDFGKSSWNLTRDGRRTPYYLHTTPKDELTRDAPVDLQQSHGCLHVRPADRDTMERLGFLRSGVELEVKPYFMHGPPR